MKTILVTGSRDWTDIKTIFRAFNEHLNIGDTLIHGDCRGADKLCAKAAEKFMLSAIIGVPADWSIGPRAGRERNKKMLAMKPDIVLAFPLRHSRGTTHMIGIAREAGVEVIIYEPYED
jgi:hypothetical protein